MNASQSTSAFPTVNVRAAILARMRELKVTRNRVCVMVSGYKDAPARMTVYRFLDGRTELGNVALGHVLYVLGLEVRAGELIPKPPPLKAAKKYEKRRKIPPRPVDEIMRQIDERYGRR